MTKRKVLLTGAAGKIAGQVLPALRERYELTLTDVRTTDRDGNEVDGIILADLTSPDREAYRHLFQGQDAVVHMGFARPDERTPEKIFRAEYANVGMAHNVYQTALEENVARVVVASSNHAADYYEALILDGKMDFVDPNGRALSDNYYGWAKEVYEHLGFVFACGVENGRVLENVQIRIGGPRETDIERCELGDLRCMRRALGAYISERDMQQLFVKSIEAEDIRDENGVPFQIFYGVSGNHHNFWSIANARKVIGYAPEDNSELRFASWIQKHIAAATAQS
ncbi:MAG: NAD(P)-dependent oxidoreductase [Anaerolineales bacterium]|nr:NAD(P)-dependent oxidoreductase [Anaerolineales bacterium]